MNGVDVEIDAEEIANSKYNQRNYNSEGRKGEGKTTRKEVPTSPVAEAGERAALYLIHISAFHDDDGKKAKKV